MTPKKNTGRPDGTDTGISKRELISEISDRTDLSKLAVKNVLDCFTDIFLREASERGSFHLVNCFVVETKIRTARRGFNVHKGSYQEYPETSVLSVRLAPKVHKEYRKAHR